MAIDLDDLQEILEDSVSDGEANPIGYGGGDLTGLTVAEADVMRSPCRALRYMADNSDYTFETFVRLSDSAGWQGISVFNKSDGSLAKKIEVRLGGGPDSDPKSLIYRNNRRIILETLKFLEEQGE